MKVTVRFNIGITAALIGYMAIISPLLLDDQTPLVVDSMLPDSDIGQLILIILSLSGGIAAGMYITRALWNRLFPELCGWKEINLAESYAISIFLSMFLIQ